MCVCVGGVGVLFLGQFHTYIHLHVLLNDDKSECVATYVDVLIVWVECVNNQFTSVNDLILWIFF